MESSPSTLDLRPQEFWPLSGKPYFYVVLKDRHLVKTFRLSIPRHVTEKLPVATIPATLVHRGKAWDMNNIENQVAGSCRFESGTWAKFAADNNLAVGDACVFELMEGRLESTHVKFKVQILKDDFPTELIKKLEGFNANNPISID